MTTISLNRNIVALVERRIPCEINVANYLMDVLCLSKEAVYRRLRDEVPFTLSEAALIAKKISVSLDEICMNVQNGTAMFNLNMVHEDNFMQSYVDKVDIHLTFLHNIKDDPTSEQCTAYSVVPRGFYAIYPEMSKFRVFRNNPVGNLDDFEMPAYIRDKQLAFSKYTQEIANSTKIIDSSAFVKVVGSVNYFRSLGSMSDRTAHAIREELFALIDDMEQYAEAGCYRNGNRLDMYISPLHFEASYSYFLCQRIKCSIITVFYVNSLSTLDPYMLDVVKSWFRKTKEVSILISQSGAVERRKYFNTQRAYLKEHIK